MPKEALSEKVLKMANARKTNYQQSCKETFFCPVTKFLTKKFPNYVFAEFFHKMSHEIEQMFVFFSIFFIWS